MKVSEDNLNTRTSPLHMHAYSTQGTHMGTKVPIWVQRDWVTTHLHPGGEGPSIAILKALAELVILRSHQRRSWPIFLAIIAKAVLRVTVW